MDAGAQRYRIKVQIVLVFSNKFFIYPLSQYYTNKF